MNKLTIFICFLFVFSNSIIGQIGFNGNPDASAALDIISNTKGLLITSNEY